MAVVSPGLVYNDGWGGASWVFVTTPFGPLPPRPNAVVHIGWATSAQNAHFGVLEWDITIIDTQVTLTQSREIFAIWRRQEDAQFFQDYSAIADLDIRDAPCMTKKISTQKKFYFTEPT